MGPVRILPFIIPQSNPHLPLISKDPSHNYIKMGRLALVLVYFACSSLGDPTGGGVYTTDEGVYTGPTLNDKAHGFGEWRGNDGEVCEGQFENDELISGKCTSAEGTYEGMFRNDEPNGKGTWYDVSGEKYVGDFVNGKAHGYGKYYNADGVLEFKGQFKNDEPIF